MGMGVHSESESAGGLEISEAEVEDGKEEEDDHKREGEDC